jgi:hypothetical protein
MKGKSENTRLWPTWRPVPEFLGRTKANHETPQAGQSSVLVTIRKHCICKKFGFIPLGGSLGTLCSMVHSGLENRLPTVGDPPR